MHCLIVKAVNATLYVQVNDDRCFILFSNRSSLTKAAKQMEVGYNNINNVPSPLVKSFLLSNQQKYLNYSNSDIVMLKLYKCLMCISSHVFISGEMGKDC